MLFSVSSQDNGNAMNVGIILFATVYPTHRKYSARCKHSVNPRGRMTSQHL